jgi:anti-sigma regulatory factor (Ser/Thr protein kinase)
VRGFRWLVDSRGPGPENVDERRAIGDSRSEDEAKSAGQE